MQLVGKEGDGEVCPRIVLQKSRHLGGLMYYHRDDEITGGNEEECHFKKCHERGDHAAFEVEQLAVEADKRLEEIGYETAYAKRKEHTFEYVYEPDDTDENHTVDDQANGAVKIVALTDKHGFYYYINV